jgi:DNA helicase HerA-like ATPase
MRMVILAASRQGKSYLAGVLAEQLMDAGSIVFIIDPEGETHTLLEKYNFIIVGGEHKTTGISLDNADSQKIGTFIKECLIDGISVIFDLSNRLEQDQQDLYALIVGHLFLAQQTLKRPMMLLVDEAQIFAPQQPGKMKEINGQTALSISQHAAKRGGKYGINSMWMTQRPASINKNVISQANIWFLGGVRAQQDVKAVAPMLEEANISELEIRSLVKGEFYHFVDGKTTKINVRKRKCTHGGATPAEKQEKLKRATKSQVEATAKKYSS